MKRTSRKPLKLDRETVRQLSHDQIQRALGALARYPTETQVAGGCYVTAGTCWWSDCQGCV